MKNTADTGTTPAADAANPFSRNGHQPNYGKGEGGKPGTYVHGDGPDALAGWISGAQWADELDVSPDEPIAKVVGTEAWKAVRKFCRKYEIPVEFYGGEGMVFEDFDALPREIWCGAKPSVAVTNQQVADFADDIGGTDPHKIGDKLRRERAQRFRERDRIEGALKPEGLSSATRYTLAAAAEGLPDGERLAATVRGLIDQENRRAWNTPAPHSHRERAYLATAGELYDLGAKVADLKKLTPATPVERDAALQILAVERRRHQLDVGRQAAACGVASLDLAAEALSVSGLALLTPVTPLIHGLIYQGQLTGLVGEPGSGKTFGALGMACSVAVGRTWCGHRVPTAMPVVYVAAEGAGGVYARVLGWCEENRVKPEALEGKLLVVPRAVQLGDDDHMAEVQRYTADKGAGLVVFDTRARCTAGLEENSATDQGQAIKRADEINQRTGAAVLVVHHTAAGSDRGRGSTAWDGALYSELRLTRNGDDVEIFCAKHKDQPSGCKHRYTLKPHTVSADLMPGADADTRNTLVMVGVDPFAVAASDEDDLTDKEAKLIALVAELGGEIGLTRAEMVTFCAEREIAGRSTVYTIVTKLVGKQLTDVGTKATPRFIVTPELSEPDDTAPAADPDGTAP